MTSAKCRFFREPVQTGGEKLSIHLIADTVHRIADRRQIVGAQQRRPPLRNDLLINVRVGIRHHRNCSKEKERRNCYEKWDRKDERHYQADNE